MTDQVTDEGTGRGTGRRIRRLPARALVRPGIALALLALVGVLAGVVWEWVWSPTIGIVVDHRWAPTDALGLQHQFSGTGWYVAVGVVAGLVAGVLVALVSDEVPLLTLVAVVVGAALGAWLMLRVGSALGPEDPARLATTAADGTRLPDNLDVSGRSPWIAYPAGVLIGFIGIYLGLAPRGPRRSTPPPAPVA